MKTSMIKGINKQILEVTNTESPYFERVIFFVRPEQNGLPENRLKKEAETYSLKLKKPPKAKRTTRQKLFGAMYILLGAGAGASLTFLMGHIA